MFDKFRDECGVFGVFGHPEASVLTYLGLYALQHRGQEGAGIVSNDGKYFHLQRGLGLVADVFDQSHLEALTGGAALGHVRYSTAGDSSLRNVQPLVVDYARGSLAIAHNGNLLNANQLREKLEKEGSIFHSTADTEIIIHLMAKSKLPDFESALVEALAQVSGAYSMLLMNEDKLIGIRDPRGFRPLCLGKLNGAYVLSSETCALDLIGASFIRNIKPGEVVVIDKNGVQSFSPFPKAKESLCIFEHIYFARPDSELDEQSITQVRRRLGKKLAQETAVGADYVIPVPDSGIYAAMGFAEESGIPYERGLIRNHYVGRTFIEPQQAIRHFGVKIKLNPVKSIVKGKKIVVVDDSIVRGTTSRKIVEMIRNAGAREVHMRISAPPSRFPCFYGIDTPTRKELIASTNTVEAISEFLSTDSLGYLSYQGMMEAVSNGRNHFCTACFSGEYPIKLPWKRKKQLRLFEKGISK
ncbi:MAG: amidophosphoribosyltransferase [bacterium]